MSLIHQKFIKHFFIAILVNGSFAALIFFISGGLAIGFYWSGEILEVWLLCLTITGLYIVLVCNPIIGILANRKPLIIHMATGSLSGILAIHLFLALFTLYPLGLKHILKKLWLNYFIFMIVGGSYGLMRYKHLSKYNLA